MLGQLIGLISWYGTHEPEATPPQDATGAPRVWSCCPGPLLLAWISKRSHTTPFLNRAMLGQTLVTTSGTLKVSHDNGSLGVMQA